MNNKGFTLIELLVVIFIIGILAGVILPNFVSSRERARDSRRKSDLNEVRSALRLYYNDNQSYPLAGTFSFGSSWSPYMQQVPQDSVDGREYNYCVGADGDNFLVCASLENAGDQEISASLSRCGTICVCDCTVNCYYACGE